MSKETKPTYPAIQIARIFLAESEKKDEVSNLKLIKLVYLAHGYCLALLDRPLIDEPVYAWKYGPAISSVYHRFIGFGGDIIPSIYIHSIEEESIDEESLELVKAVWDAYRDHSALSLSTLAHEEGTPWDIIKKEFGKNFASYPDIVIPDYLIKAHYEKLIKEQKDKEDSDGK